MRNATVALTSILLICLLSCELSAQHDQGSGSDRIAEGIRELDNGDQVSWDGEFYDFKAADGFKMVKMWIPPGVSPVRGMLISGHGGGSGDSRQFARDENIRAFAMRLGFAVVGIHNFPGRQVYEEGAEVLFHALDAFAALGLHPEIPNIPFVMFGSSNGGASTYGMVNYAPERAICFVTNVSAGYVPEKPVPEALMVPGIFIMGQFDGLIRQRGIDQTDLIVNRARVKKALWAWANELKGHEDGFAFDVYMKFVEQAVKARYPSEADPKKERVKLRELKQEDGWLVDQGSWDSGFTYVDSYSDYGKDRAEAGWVLNRDMAYVYRAMATHHNPAAIYVEEFDRTLNTHTDPGTMFSLGGPVVDPGEKINIKCRMPGIDDWTSVDFYNGSRKIGTVKKGEEPAITYITDTEDQVVCLLAVVNRDEGKTSTTSPFHFFVRDPGLAWKVSEELPEFTRLRSGRGRVYADQEYSGPGPGQEDLTLVSYGLNTEMEQQFNSRDGKLSGFWDRITTDHDRIALSQRRHASEGSSFRIVVTNDCNMTVRSAYGAYGLYLLFEVNDDAEVSWPREFTGNEKEHFYSDFDALDFMLDARSSAEIASPEGRKLFVSPHFAFTATTCQYQSALGTPNLPVEGIRVSRPEPWDMHARYRSYEDLRRHFGIEIENIKTGHYHRAQEWFIPWNQVGGELRGEPALNTRFAFSCGFNDRDPGEHLPPGFDSSGGTVRSSNRIRWINGSDPWGASPVRSGPPFNWGDIVLGPAL